MPPTDHRLTEINPVTKLAICSLCGPARITCKGLAHWQCRTAFREAKRRRLRASREPDPPRPGGGVFGVGGRVQMSDHLRKVYRTADGHVDRFWRSVGTIVAPEPGTARSWLVRWPEASLLYPYSEVNLTLHGQAIVIEPAAPDGELS